MTSLGMRKFKRDPGLVSRMYFTMFMLGILYAVFAMVLYALAVNIIFIGVIVNGMTLLNVQPYYQYIVRGALILAAVLVNRFKETLAR